MVVSMQNNYQNQIEKVLLYQYSTNRLQPNSIYWNIITIISIIDDDENEY